AFAPPVGGRRGTGYSYGRRVFQAPGMTMLLAIDAGNTNIVFALYDGAKLIGTWRAATKAQRTADEYAAFLGVSLRNANIDPKAVKAAIIASVVPDANFHLKTLCEHHFGCAPLMVGDASVQTGIKVLLDRPEEVGADRIVNAIGGVAAVKPPLLII